MDSHIEKDDILFDALSRKKKRRRRRIVLITATVLALAGAGLFFGVRFMRRQVNERFLTGGEDVLSYEASVGSISTTVSGSGVLSAVGSEQLTVPAGVEIEELAVRRGNTLQAGDVIATVDRVSVMTALADAQEALDTLSAQIEDAENDTVNSHVTASIHGRVKKVFAAEGDSVLACMTENGALAILSADGTMAVDIRSSAMESGTAVEVVCSDGKKYDGTVEKSTGNTVTVILTDNGPAYGDIAEVYDADGRALGSGGLYIHSPIAVTGYAGTIDEVYAAENQYVYAETTLFKLTDTLFNANYETLLRERQEKEEELTELLGLLHTLALLAPYDGTVISIDYTAANAVSTAATAVITYAPNEQVSVSISVDETDILSLALGQSADVTVSSVSEEIFEGEVTEIDKVAESSSGVSYYTAVITLAKSADMLTGMTATADVKISGSENAVLIPLEALHRTGTSAYVYTSYDEETKEYGGMVEVVSGISNSRYVEIRSGLSEGDTVYYTESQSNDPFAQFGGAMPGGMGGFGGEQGGMSFGGDPGAMAGRDFSGGAMPNGFSGGNGGGMSGANRGNRSGG